MSTARQGASGLCLEAQRAAVAAHLNGGSWTFLRKIVEVESGKWNDRPALTEAISKRIKAALAAAKARGTVLGGRRVSAERFAEIGAAARQTFNTRAAQRRAQVLTVIAEIRGQRISTLRAIAVELNERAIVAPHGGQWSAVQVQRVLKSC